MDTLRSGRNISGTIVPPGDKSISHRAAFLGALSSRGMKVENFSPGADCASTLRCLSQLGCSISRNEGSVNISRGGAFHDPQGILHAGNSGTTARLLTGLLSALPGAFAVISGDSSLQKRPMGRVVRPLQAMGARIDGRDGGVKLPLSIRGSRLSGAEHVPSAASAQVKTALILAGLSALGSTTVHEKRPTRDHTERMLDFLGVPHLREGNSFTVYPCNEIPGGEWTIPGDFSAAAFWIVAGALSSEKGLQIKDTGINPTRTGILKVLERMGCVPEIRNRRNWGGEEVADLEVRRSSLRGTVIEADEIPSLVDELPLLALAATQAEGITEVRGAGELRFKECDRIHAVTEGLSALGAHITEKEDGWIIEGGTPLSGGRVRSFSDHRIVMTFSIASLVTEGDVSIDDTSSVEISDPSFLRELVRKTGENAA